MKLVFAFYVLIIGCISCSPSNKMGKDKYGADKKYIKGTTVKRCPPPSKTYAKDLEVKVKSSIDSLAGKPIGEVEASLSQKVVRLSDYSQSGLDVQLILYYTCVMANNQGFSSEQTERLITQAINAWDNKKKSDPRHLNDEDIKRLKNRFIDKSKPIEVVYVSDCSECEKFATEVGEYLKFDGFTIQFSKASLLAVTSDDMDRRMALVVKEDSYGVYINVRKDE